MIEDHVLTPKAPPSNTSSGGEAQSQELTLSALQRQFVHVTDEVAELARLVRGGAKRAVHTAVDRAGDFREDTTDRARELEDQAVAWIKERPLQASLLSMGLGALLWSMLKRS